MKISPSQKICTLPFESVEVNSNGKLYFCCASWQKKPFGDLQKESILNEWSSSDAKEIRHSILDGSYKFCNKEMCPYLQTDCLKRFDELSEKQQNILIEQGVELVEPPVKLMLNYDLSCNLSCPSCRCEKISISTSDQNFVPLKNMTESIVFDFFKKASHQQIKLNITGSGDPFASQVFRQFLENLNGSLFPNLSIDLQTNGVLFTENMWARLEKIHNNIDSVFLSLDAATKETYLDVRRGGNWEIINNNINFLRGLRLKDKIKRFQLHFVVQKRNYSEMVQFSKIFNIKGVDLIYFSLVDDWGVWTKEIYEEQAVWKSNHKEHNNLLLVLSHPIFELPNIFIGNLSSLREKAIWFRAEKLNIFNKSYYLSIIFLLRLFFQIKKKLYKIKLKWISSLGGHKFVDSDN